MTKHHSPRSNQTNDSDEPAPETRDELLEALALTASLTKSTDTVLAVQRHYESVLRILRLAADYG